MGQFTMSLYPRTLLNVLPVDCNVIVAIRTGLFMIKSQGMTWEQQHRHKKITTTWIISVCILEKNVYLFIRAASTPHYKSRKKIAYLISCMKVRLQYFIARVTSANPQQMCIFLYISAIMVEFFRRGQTNSMLTELCKLFIWCERWSTPLVYHVS